MKDVCSPVNRMKRPPPSPNARPLSSVNPKTAHPQERGPRAPNADRNIALPAVKLR
jgi:hypothetical protein